MDPDELGMTGWQLAAAIAGLIALIAVVVLILAPLMDPSLLAS